MKLKEAHSNEKHWETKYGKKPLDVQLALKYTTKSDVVRKEERELQDLFDAVVLEIKERQQFLRDLERIEHPDKVSLTEPSEVDSLAYAFLNPGMPSGTFSALTPDSWTIETQKVAIGARKPMSSHKLSEIQKAAQTNPGGQLLTNNRPSGLPHSTSTGINMSKDERQLNKRKEKLKWEIAERVSELQRIKELMTGDKNLKTTLTKGR